jgi:hypothetical protein
MAMLLCHQLFCRTAGGVKVVRGSTHIDTWRAALLWAEWRVKWRDRRCTWTKTSSWGCPSPIPSSFLYPSQCQM